jgi:hypothetical protein
VGNTLTEVLISPGSGELSNFAAGVNENVDKAKEFRDFLVGFKKNIETAQDVVKIYFVFAMFVGALALSRLISLPDFVLYLIEGPIWNYVDCLSAAQSWVDSNDPGLDVKIRNIATANIAISGVFMFFVTTVSVVMIMANDFTVPKGADEKNGWVVFAAMLSFAASMGMSAIQSVGLVDSFRHQQESVPAEVSYDCFSWGMATAGSLIAALMMVEDISNVSGEGNSLFSIVPFGIAATIKLGQVAEKYTGVVSTASSSMTDCVSSLWVSANESGCLCFTKNSPHATV